MCYLAQKVVDNSGLVPSEVNSTYSRCSLVVGKVTWTGWVSLWAFLLVVMVVAVVVATGFLVCPCVFVCFQRLFPVACTWLFCF